MQEKSVAIDGPAGAGKSTLARALARELGYLYVDTGAIYRTVALRAWEAGADPSDPEQIAPLLKGLDLRMDYGADGVQRMYLSGRDVTEAIRVHQISGLASQVAALPPVRDFLLDFQRRQAMEHDVVMDGRRWKSSRKARTWGRAATWEAMPEISWCRMSSDTSLPDKYICCTPSSP